MKLIIPTDITRQMHSIVYDTELATGLSLFGEKEGQDFIVTSIAGPGPDATHQELHYSGNKDYATMVWDFKVFPAYFSRSQPEGIDMEAVFEGQVPYRNVSPRSARFRRR